MSTAYEQFKALVQSDPEAKLAIAKARIRRDLLNEIHDIIEPVSNDDWDNIDAAVSRFSVEISLLDTAAHKKTLEELTENADCYDCHGACDCICRSTITDNIVAALARLEPKSAEEKNA